MNCIMSTKINTNAEYDPKHSIFKALHCSLLSLKLLILVFAQTYTHSLSLLQKVLPQRLKQSAAHRLLTHLKGGLQIVSY